MDIINDASPSDRIVDVDSTLTSTGHLLCLDGEEENKTLRSD